MMGLMTFLPLGFFGGYIPARLLKKAGLLRVPPEVELEGLDIAEFQPDFFPEFEHPAEVIMLRRRRSRVGPGADRGIQRSHWRECARVRGRRSGE